jgi:hypothetical protein
MLTEAQLRIGRIFEAEFERQAHKRGLFCVRHCDQQGTHGVKAPIATGPYAGYRLPDFSVMKNGETFWAEVKYKTGRTFTHSIGIYEHGIDLPNWRDYIAICKLSGQRGFLVIGEADTGNILIAPFERLAAVPPRLYPGPVHFEKGAAFWPCTVFSSWGTFNRQNGQLNFNFTFAAGAGNSAQSIAV